MKNRLIFVLFLFLFIDTYPQIIDSTSVQFEKNIRYKLDSAKVENHDDAKLRMMKEIESDLAGFLKNAASYNYPFDSLKLIGKVTSPDNEFRMFNWNVPVNSDSFRNYCIIQFNPKKESQCHVIVFLDNSDIDKAGDAALPPGNWYGALYYKIIPVQFKGQTYYTLLGFDSFSPYVSKKIIDVFFFKNGIPCLGAPVFNAKGENFSRVVFSFSARISMMLNYDEVLKTIVFDHLSPTEPRYAGQFEFYGPDFSFDGFVLSKDQWLFSEDIKPNRPAPKDKNAPRKGSNMLGRK